MRGLAAGCVLCVILGAGVAADSKPGASPTGPLPPREELATFRVAKGFRVELVASEPDVIDPVAMAFDEDGRLYVAEMRGYPNGGVSTGDITSGKIRRLEDRDGDGFYERSTIYAEGLRFPASAMPWKGGVLVADVPNLFFFEDIDGDGKADRKRVLYTGFDLSNSEQLLNALQWGLDNWVYGNAAGGGGSIRSPEKPDMPSVVLRGRSIRFHPEVPGSLQPTSGGGQYGLAADDWERWFVNTNNQHLRHVVLPDHYLQRNPALAVSMVTLDIPDHGAACKVHRISAFEAWRVERTRRRKAGEGGYNPKNFPETELVPGGYITSGCSPVIYTAGLFPPAYLGNTFMCDPANNLIHRDILVPSGATFIAQRGDADCEFLASTDNWFRPVSLTIGPDGALYVCDFYREVIETPLSLPDDIKKKVNLESRGRGRIWRIVLEGTKRPKKPALSKATSAELVQHLDDRNSWWRLTAQRLLVERQDKKAVEPLQQLAKDATTPQGRVHALWTLHSLKALDDKAVERALKDQEPAVREQALRLAEDSLAASPSLVQAVAALTDDPSPRVRFQLAFTLGESQAPEAVRALANVARRDADDPWTQSAVLSSTHRSAPALLEELTRDKEFAEKLTSGRVQLLTRLAAIAGAPGDDASIGRVLKLLASKKGRPEEWQRAILRGLGQGLQQGQRSLSRLWDAPPAGLRETVEAVRPFFGRAATTATDGKAPPAERLAAIQLLSYGPYKIAGTPLAELLTPQTPSDLQLAAVRALSQHEDARVADALLAPWVSFSPTVRREVIEALFARPARLTRLLDAMEKQQVLSIQMEPFRLQQLRKHSDATVRRRAEKLLACQATADRQKVLDAYRSALDLKADVTRGKAVFKMVCSTCHRLEDVGIEVGPDLLSALRNKSREQLLIDILDPSREVDPRYINYVATTKAGRSFSGMIAAETASSITLRRAEKAEDVILRNQIDVLEATAKSVMPEGLEMQLGQQEVADVIAYLQAVARPK
jgi:putative membrane-bound dehydrogenase-like protein